MSFVHSIAAALKRDPSAAGVNVSRLPSGAECWNLNRRHDTQRTWPLLSGPLYVRERYMRLYNDVLGRCTRAAHYFRQSWHRTVILRSVFIRIPLHGTSSCPILLQGGVWKPGSCDSCEWQAYERQRQTSRAFTTVWSHAFRKEHYSLNFITCRAIYKEYEKHATGLISGCMPGLTDEELVRTVSRILRAKHREGITRGGKGTHAYASTEMGQCPPRIVWSEARSTPALQPGRAGG
jgi:hypothetical protein